jgi:hypothetical protein
MNPKRLFVALLTETLTAGTYKGKLENCTESRCLLRATLVLQSTGAIQIGEEIQDAIQRAGHHCNGSG